MRRWLCSASYIFVIVVYGTVTSLGSVAGSLNRVVGAPLLVVWFYTVIMQGGVRKPHAFHLLFLLFFCWNVASLCWTRSVIETLMSLQHYWPVLLWSMMLWDLYRTRPKVEAALQALVLGGYLVTLVTVFNHFHNGGANSPIKGRDAALGIHPDEVGMLVAIVMPIAWYLASTRPGRPWLRALNYACPIATVITIVLSAGRGALLAAIPPFIFVVLNLGKLTLPKKLAIAVILLGMGGLLMKIDVSKKLERLASTAGSASRDKLSGRLLIWDFAIHEFARSPLLGDGTNSFRIATLGDENISREYETGIPAHNVFLSILAELGIPGFILFMLILLVVFQCALRHRGMMRWMWISSLASYLISACSLTLEGVAQTWLILLLVVISNSCADTVPAYTRVTRLASPVPREPANALPV